MMWLEIHRYLLDASIFTCPLHITYFVTIILIDTTQGNGDLSNLNNHLVVYAASTMECTDNISSYELIV